MVTVWVGVTGEWEFLNGEQGKMRIIQLLNTMSSSKDLRMKRNRALTLLRMQ